MSKVTLTPIKGQTGLINKYELSADGEQRGYILATQEKIEFGKQFSDTVVRTAFIKGKVSTLESIVREHPNRKLDGKIVVQEYLESQVPEELYKEFANKKEEDVTLRLDGFVKRSPKVGEVEGIECTVDDERIIRFSYYNDDRQDSDITVQHDNGDMIRAHGALQDAEVARLKLMPADLPGAGGEE